MADTEAAEGPGVGHEQRSRIGGRQERRSYPLTGRRSTQRNHPNQRGLSLSVTHRLSRPQAVPGDGLAVQMRLLVGMPLIVD